MNKEIFDALSALEQENHIEKDINNLFCITFF